MTDRSGVTAVEYALIAGVISIVAVSAFAVIGDKLNNIFVSVAGGF